MVLIRIIIRSLLMLLHVICGILILITVNLLGGRGWYSRPFGRRLIAGFMASFARSIGMRIHITGAPQAGMLVANHVSWLDIIALDAVRGCRFISKDDVLHWPVIGLLPKWSGTFFLRRGSAAAVNALNSEIEAALHQGDTVAFFPEGTTHEGDVVHPFRAAVLQAALNARAHVQAVGIRFIRDGQLDPLAPYINNDHILGHFFRLIKQARTDVFLNYTEAFIPDESMTRKELAELLRQQVEQQLQPLG